MSRKTKETRKLKNSRQEELEIKRKKYREGVEKNPYPMDHGIEMKECEGCYCQMFASSNHYSFCSGCIGCENLGCPGGCCDCYSDGSRGGKGSDGKIVKGSHGGKEKKLSFAQKQRLHGEQVIQNAWDMIEEIRDYEDTDDMLTAKKIEDVKRGTQQEKEHIIKNLTDEELGQELIKRKKVKSGEKNKSEQMILLDEYERNRPYSGCSHCGEEFDGNDQDFKKYENAGYCLNCYNDIEDNNQK